MARSSKTEYAILGLLSLHPMSGYDMKAFVSTSIGFFWHESYGQLYPTLNRLLKEKRVSRTIEAGAGGPDRHVYAITDAGRAHLEEWLAADTEPETIRNELLLKLFFGPSTVPSVHLTQIRAFLEQQQERLARLRSVEEEVLKEWEGTSFHPYFHATLRYGVHMARARVAWCGEVLERLREIEAERSKESTANHGAKR